MPVEVLEAPQYEPVSLADARTWVRADPDDTSQDGIIQLLIKAARERAENLTGRAFVQRTLRLLLRGWPSDPVHGAKILLPFPPLSSVSSVKYIDVDGVLQTMSTADYVVHDGDLSTIVPAYGVVWPAVRDVPNAVQVTYIAGYPPVGSPTDEAAHQAGQPALLREWMHAHVATMFEHRESVITGTIVSALPTPFVDGLLDPLVVGRRLF